MSEAVRRPWLKYGLHSLMILLLAAAAFLAGHLSSRSKFVEAEDQLATLQRDLKRAIHAQHDFEYEMQQQANRARRMQKPTPPPAP